MAVMSPGGLEGVADVDPYGIQWQGWRPAGVTSRPNPAKSRESKSRVRPAPLRGLGALAVQE
jgi:hypothetical protein